MNEKEIRINLLRESLEEVIPVVQRDTSRELVFVLTDYQIPAGAEANINAVKPDGKMVYNLCDIEENKVRIKLTEQMIVETGPVKCQVEINVGDETVTSFQFTLMSRQRVRNDVAIESTNEFTVLEKTMKEAKQAAQDATSGAAAANTSAGKADTAAGKANEAATKADTSAGKADTATGKAETAATKANTAAEGADKSADRANTAAAKNETLYDKLKDFDGNISAGVRNLAQGTSSEYSEPFTAFTGSENKNATVGEILNEDLQVGDTISIRLIYKYDNIVAADGQTATVLLQFEGDVTGWLAAGAPPATSRITLSGSGVHEISYSFKATANQLQNNYWKAYLRHDYVQSGSIRWKCFSVYKGTSNIDWTPAPEDTDTKLATKKNDLWANCYIAADATTRYCKLADIPLPTSGQNIFANITVIRTVDNLPNRYSCELSLNFRNQGTDYGYAGYMHILSSSDQTFNLGYYLFGLIGGTSLEIWAMTQSTYCGWRLIFNSVTNQRSVDLKVTTYHDYTGQTAAPSGTKLLPVQSNIPVNNLTTTTTGSALDAAQGKALNDKIAAINTDSGWLTNFTYSSGWSAYETSGSNQPRFRKVGKTVHLVGAFTNASALNAGTGTSVVMATLPAGYRPSVTHRCVQQGSSFNKFQLIIDTDGKIIISRYGTTAEAQINANTWAVICCSFLVD